MKQILAGLSFLFAGQLVAQDSTTTVAAQNPASLTISGYAEAYYSYDLNRPASNNRPGFLYNYNRHNEFNLNLGFIKAAYATERVRANIAVGLGTYMNANYTAEPGTLKNVFEANAGYRLSGRNHLWLDVGILPSHIGFESAIGKDNWNLTRSLVAENSPYFESGARLSYTTDNGKLVLAALALNGWQRITRLEGHSLLSYGSQITYKPNSKITLNYSNFVGTDKPDTARQWRYYHNMYGIFQLSTRLGLIAGFDMGMEEASPTSGKLHTWYTPVAILRIQPADQWAIALRGEYYSDRQGVIIATGTPNGFQTGSASVNIDYLPQHNLVLRLEGRSFFSRDAVFLKGTAARHHNNAISFSTAISF